MKNFFQLFSRRNEEPVKKYYDLEKQRPAIRCSICTGEQVACMRSRSTGKLHEVMFLRIPEDLEVFCRNYGVRPEDLRKVY